MEWLTDSRQNREYIQGAMLHVEGNAEMVMQIKKEFALLPFSKLMIQSTILVIVDRRQAIVSWCLSCVRVEAGKSVEL